MDFSIIDILYLIIIWAVSIWLHEYAHALSSYMLWDPTPKLQNRLTPNPLAHIDPIGFLMIFLIHFWRWKPVQVNPAYYKNPLRDELIVSLAWPFTNLLLSIFWMFFILIYAKFGLNIQNPNAISSNDMLIYFWLLFSQVNIWLAIFNMIPMPPLDGYRLIKFFWPRVGFIMDSNPYLPLIMLILVLTVFSPIIWSIISVVFSFLFSLFTNIIY